jgi:glycine cleavage system regulatory protein
MRTLPLELLCFLFAGAVAGCVSPAEESASESALSSVSWVQTATGTESTHATFASAETAGDLNVVVMGWGDDTTTITGVSDTRGNSYFVAAPMVTGTGSVSPPLRQTIYYAKNVAAGSNTVTVSFSGTPSYPDLKILEYSGADSTAPLDVAVSASGTSSTGTVASGSATTTAANELIVGAGMTTDRFSGPGASFTQRVLSSDGNLVEDRLVSTAGSYSATIALDGNEQSWLVQLVTFKAQSGSPPAPAPTLSGISPTSGTTAGGISTTVSGAHFVSGAKVSFCGTAAKVTFVSTSSLTAVSPANAAGPCNVVVQNPDGQSATLPGAFTYQAPSGGGSISWVQTQTGATSATFASTQSAGNLNVVVIGWGDDTASITGVSDTRGNAYAVAAPMVTETGTVSPPLRQAIYYAKNIAAGSNTVTVSFSGTPSYPDLKILEYGGADSTAPLDVAASASGTSATGTVASGSATTTAASELIVGAGMTTDRFSGPGASFTQRVLSNDGNLVEDRLVSTAGSYSATIALDGNQQSWLAQMVTFKAGSGGTCTPTTCAAQDKNCGSLADGCGGTLSCGSCVSPQTCGGAGTPNVCGASSGPRTYSTNFPLTENPISEGGNWIGGQSAGGNLWGNVETTAGQAFGVTEPTSFGDPTALLTGTWGASQTAEGTVRIVSAQPAYGAHEIELRLRQTISPSTITGYEVYCSLVSGNAYCHVASWGGPNGAWVNLDDCLGNDVSLYLRDGDVLKGTVSGTNPVVVTAYVNGAQILQVEDRGTCTFSDGRKYGPWTSGSPGIGFYTSGDFDFSSYGWASYTVTAQ